MGCLRLVLTLLAIWFCFGLLATGILGFLPLILLLFFIWLIWRQKRTNGPPSS